MHFQICPEPFFGQLFLKFVPSVVFIELVVVIPTSSGVVVRQDAAQHKWTPTSTAIAVMVTTARQTVVAPDPQDVTTCVAIVADSIFVVQSDVSASAVTVAIASTMAVGYARLIVAPPPGRLTVLVGTKRGCAAV